MMHRLVFLVAFGWILFSAQQINAQALMDKLQLPPHWHEQYEVVSETGGVLTWRDRETKAVFKYLVDETATTPKAFGFADTLWAEKTITINTFDIDTTLYADRFEWMGEAPLNARYTELLVYDSNNNGKAELIGLNKSIYRDYTMNRFYEWDEQFSYFKMVVDFVVVPSEKGGLPVLAGDIDKDGLSEIYAHYGDQLRVYEAANPGDYATEYRYTHHPVAPEEPQGFGIYNLDNDNFPDLLHLRYNNSSPGASSTIREHVSGDTNFQVIGDVMYNPNFGIGKLAVGDIDQDGFMEYFKADLYGRVYGVENVANDSFQIHYTAQLPYYNAMYHLAPGDLDGDGLPEAYLGGTWGSHNYITVIEGCGNDCYRPTVLLDVIRGNSFYIRKLFSGDVDGDGHDELILDVGGFVLVLKVPGNDQYEEFWAKRVSWADGIGVGDVDGNGTDDIVICKEIWTNNDFYSQSDVYRFNPLSVGIPANQPAVANAITLFPNYPNPFNPTTTIRFTLPVAADVALSVLNIRGQVVADILDERRSAGEHLVVFDASVLSSGVYFCRMVSGSFSQVHKMVVVR
ncbi:MAG: T9SS type A sorting domain-containing protein [Calditrichia bacterium]